MSPHNSRSFLVVLVIYICSDLSCDGANITISADYLNPIQANSPVFKPVVNSFSSLSLLSAFPDDLEISDYCTKLLHLFGQQYVAYVNCLVPAARPVKVCQNCFSSYGILMHTYNNISSDEVIHSHYLSKLFAYTKSPGLALVS